MPQHPDASYIVNFDYLEASPDYATWVYCESACYDMSAEGLENPMDAYDGVTPYVAVETGVDYDVGSSGGQVMATISAAQSMNSMAFTEEEGAAMWAGMEAWMYSYFNWFGASNWVFAASEGSYGSGYTYSDVLTILYVDQPTEAYTVTFTEYPPKGWIGWCTVPNCDGQTPTGIHLNYGYDAMYYYFVYYATSDAVDQGTGDAVAEVTAWAETNFPWTVEPETSAPDSDGVAAILSAIGADPAPLTITLIWDAPVDLDLYFYCDDGAVINY